MNLDILKEIKDGWTNLIWPNDQIEKMAEERAQVCASCPHADPLFPFIKKLSDEEAKAKGKTTEIIRGLGCKKCGCVLSAKTRSPLSECPEKLWPTHE